MITLQEISSIQNVDRKGLKDIKDVVIDTSLPRDERVRNYVEQIGNPYCYLDGGVVVSISYANTEVSLQDRLRSYVSSM